MFTLACDVCELPIKETGYVCDMVEAKLVYGEETVPRVTEHGQILSLYLCGRCAAQVQRKIHTLRARAGPG